MTMAWTGRLGVPYQGSKNAIAREIVSCLPSGTRFVDLFAGGCAVTHAAVLSGKYERFLANDLHGFGVRLFMDAVAGKHDGAWRRWVSREEFEALKGTDPMVALCWSFGNGGSGYLFGKDTEAAKREEHARRCRGERATMESESIERLTGLERLHDLARLGVLERMTAAKARYDEVELKEGDVVYCDPPYADTAGYSTEPFDSEKFWAWCDSRDFPVFVSEYKAPDGFVPIWVKGKKRLMNQRGTDGKVREYVFVQKRYAGDFQTDFFLGEDD